MIHLHIISFGHSRTLWCDLAIKEYIHRMRRWATLQLHYLSFDGTIVLPKTVASFPSLLLDHRGRKLDSAAFSSFVFSKIEEGGARLNWVIGPKEGFSSLPANFPAISLSPLILTHEMAKLLLIEQLYRMFMIRNNHPYAT